jgi:hypothetical protein
VCVCVQVCSTWETKQDTRHQPLLHPPSAVGSSRGDLRFDTRLRTDHGMARLQRTPHHSDASTASSISRARISYSVASAWRRGTELSKETGPRQWPSPRPALPRRVNRKGSGRRCGRYLRGDLKGPSCRLEGGGEKAIRPNKTFSPRNLSFTGTGG